MKPFNRSSKFRVKPVEELVRPGKEERLVEFLMASGRLSCSLSDEMLDKRSLNPPELPELASELTVGKEEMLESRFTKPELSSMLLERLELAVMFPKMEKLARLLVELLARLLELPTRMAWLEPPWLASWRLLLPIPSMAKLDAVPHFGWEEEEVARRSVTLDRLPMLEESESNSQIKVKVVVVVLDTG